MNSSFRNTALLQLQSVMPSGHGASLSETHFRTGDVLECRLFHPNHWVFPQQGVLVLQQVMGVQVVSAALLDQSTGLVPDREGPSPWRLQALCDGFAHLLSVPVSEQGVCAEVWLGLQMALMQKVAVWGHCRQQHSLTPRLAGLLSSLTNHAQPWDWTRWPQVLDCAWGELQASLHGLQGSGAINVQENLVTIIDASKLVAQACPCLGGTRRLSGST